MTSEQIDHTATVEGTVSDTSGAAVPEAAVVLRNLNTAASQTVSTDSQGRYLLADVGVGQYQIRVSKSGFANSIRSGVTLTVGSRSVVDFVLQVGQATETVTVQAQASQVETTNAAVASLTDQQQVHDLPLNGPNLEQLIQLAPGVNTIQGNAFVANGFLGRANEYSIAGGRSEGQGLLLNDESIQNFWNKGCHPLRDLL